MTNDIQQTEPQETRWNIIEQWPEPVGPEIFDEIQDWWTTYTYMTCLLYTSDAADE